MNFRTKIVDSNKNIKTNSITMSSPSIQFDLSKFLQIPVTQLSPRWSRKVAPRRPSSSLLTLAYLFPSIIHLRIPNGSIPPRFILNTQQWQREVKVSSASPSTHHFARSRLSKTEVIFGFGLVSSFYDFYNFFISAREQLFLEIAGSTCWKIYHYPQGSGGATSFVNDSRPKSLSTKAREEKLSPFFLRYDWAVLKSVIP